MKGDASVVIRRSTLCACTHLPLAMAATWDMVLDVSLFQSMLLRMTKRHSLGYIENVEYILVPTISEVRHDFEFYLHLQQ
jgi:hypothetical protein